MDTHDPREDPAPDPITEGVVAGMAMQVLLATRALQPVKARDALSKLITEHGDLFAVAFAVWCDEAIDSIADVTSDNDDAAELIQCICAIEEEGGPERRWAGRILWARAADDRDAFIACLREANTLDSDERYERITALLATAATTVASCDQLRERARAFHV